MERNMRPVTEPQGRRNIARAQNCDLYNIVPHRAFL